MNDRKTPEDAQEHLHRVLKELEPDPESTHTLGKTLEGKSEPIPFNVALQVPLLEFPGKWIALSASYEKPGKYHIYITVEKFLDDAELDRQDYEIHGAEDQTTYSWALSADTQKEIYHLATLDLLTDQLLETIDKHIAHQEKQTNRSSSQTNYVRGYIKGLNWTKTEIRKTFNK